MADHDVVGITGAPGAGNHVFVRPLASRGRVGGLAALVPDAVRVLGAVGYDPAVVETVGIRQVECDVAGLADTCVLVAAPGRGGVCPGAGAIGRAGSERCGGARSVMVPRSAGARKPELGTNERNHAWHPQARWS